MAAPILELNEFHVFQKIIFKEAGIDINDKKKTISAESFTKKNSFL